MFGVRYAVYVLVNSTLPWHRVDTCTLPLLSLPPYTKEHHNNTSLPVFWTLTLFSKTCPFSASCLFLDSLTMPNFKLTQRASQAVLHSLLYITTTFLCHFLNSLPMSKEKLTQCPSLSDIQPPPKNVLLYRWVMLNPNTNKQNERQNEVFCKLIVFHVLNCMLNLKFA